MNTAAHPRAHRPSEGTASVDRLHEAWRSGVLPIAAPTHRRGPMTADPYRLDDGIPTLIERHAARPKRAAPHLHLVHRVDTLTDLPADAAGVALGDAALPAGFRLAGDPSIHTADQTEPVVTVDQALRARVWRGIVAAYLVVSVGVGLYLYGA